MEARLEKKLSELKKVVTVYDPENPLLNVQDALRIAKREGLMYRYETDGKVWRVRFKEPEKVMVIPQALICETIVNKILEEKGKKVDKVLEEPKADPVAEYKAAHPEANATDGAIKLALESGVDLDGLMGTGNEGKITVKDVRDQG